MSGEWYLSVPEFVTINGGGRMVAFLFCISRGSFSPAVRCQMWYGQLLLLHPSLGLLGPFMHQISHAPVYDRLEYLRQCDWSSSSVMFYFVHSIGLIRAPAWACIY